MFLVEKFKKVNLANELVQIRKNLADLGYVGRYQEYNPLKKEAGIEYLAYRDEGGKAYLKGDFKRLCLTDRIKKRIKRKKIGTQDIFCNDVEKEMGEVCAFFEKHGYKKFGEENFTYKSNFRRRKIVMKKGDLFFCYYVEIVDF